MPIYHVKTPTGDRLVDANTKAAAINYVTRGTVTADPVSASAMIQLMNKGIKCETATEPTPEAAAPAVDDTKSAA